MLIKVLHQEKGSSKLLAKFPNKAFELIPTVFTVLETYVFTARCTLVQSAVLRSHVVCLSVCLSVCNVGEL